MEHLKNVTVIAGKLSGLLTDYIYDLKRGGQGFEDFSDEAVIYAFLEYAKFPRNYTKEERIIYLHGKCLEYDGKPHQKISVDFDDQYGSFIVLYPQKPPVSSNLPF